MEIIIDGNNHEIFKVNDIILKQVDNEVNFRFKDDFILSKIKFEEGSIFNDSLRKATLKELNSLDLFTFPSVQYDEINGNKLNANIILNNKKRFALDLVLI